MQPRPRVLALAQSAAMGGAELALERIARRLPEHGFEVDVVGPAELPLGGIERGAGLRALASWPRARALAGRYDLVLMNGIVTQRLAPAMTRATLVPYIHELVDSGPRAWRSARFWGSAPVVLCACEAVAQRCRAFGAPGDRLRTVYAPVESADPAPRPEWSDGSPVVGFVGAVEAHKGVLELARAMHAVEARLVVVGDGSLLGELRAAAPVGSVFSGHVRDAQALMPWFDVLALPSHREAFGTVAAEALAAGTPVVATRSGGVEEYVVPGRNGALVMPGDVDALAEALRTVLPQAASMAEAAREDARRFGSERVGASVAQALSDALAIRGRR